MHVERIFEDLFAYGHESLAWVRVYQRGGSEAVALALNPVDNPGASVGNDPERLLAGLERAFSTLGEMRLFIRFPDDPRGRGWTEIVKTANQIEFERHSVECVEALVSEALVDPADVTCAGLGGRWHPLLALIPPPEPDRNRIDELRVVAVADLPWPHNPGSCRWRQRFEDLRELYPSDRDDQPALGAHWSLILSEDDLRSCQYHQADWRRVAEVSVNVLDALPQGAEIDDAITAVEEALGDSAEGDWCSSLFTDPIVWHPEQRVVVNGQHRSCALRGSGAPLCIADVVGAYLEEPVAGDPRRRAAAEVASYWIRRAAR